MMDFNPNNEGDESDGRWVGIIILLWLVAIAGCVAALVLALF